ncbi:hypothetical protein [Sporosarcina sp. FSL K6-1508]|uniref:hypothetical protein n=1 Tax=Sporosarcina sp. FSL K6-1508 TaxID=2921553 RepID=UPI0030F93387
MKKERVIRKITPSFDRAVNESNYEKALKAMPDWKSSDKVKVYGAASIQSVAEIRFSDAAKLLNRLTEKGRISS